MRARIVTTAFIAAIAGCGSDNARTADSDTSETSQDTALETSVPTEVVDAVDGVEVVDAADVVDAAEVAETAAPMTLTAITPTIVDPLGGSMVVVTGTGLEGLTALTIGGVAATEVRSVSATEVRARSGAVASASGLDVVATRGDVQATLAGAVDAWSPVEIAEARVFDAASGIRGDEVLSTYEWQRLTTEIAPDWKGRDGVTVTWFPKTEQFWMVGGWNPFPQPDGYPSAPNISPNETTTNEVWSSPDGATWTQVLPHLHDQFEPRHTHGTVAWHDKLWVVGGDTHLNHYNHDVLSSVDGANWVVEVADPPWPKRAFSVMGVYDDKLWLFGGAEFMLWDKGRTLNDLWRSSDGVTWEEVAGHADDDDPAVGVTRPSGRGAVQNLVEFKGRMWLIGGGRYREWEPGSEHFAEVWSTADGVTWTKHADPPWLGKHWADVKVWDDKLWFLFGHSPHLGNSNDVWFSDDGDHWTALPPDQNIHPGDHAQGIAVTEDFILHAGGNGAWANGAPPGAREIQSTWRLKRFRGTAVERWTERGAGQRVLSATGAARPVYAPDALGPGMPGVQFDGSKATLTLASADMQPDGRSVFWVGRSPWMPTPVEWEPVAAYNALWTVVGDEADAHSCAVGLGAGTLFYTSASGGGWQSHEVGSDLQVATGEVRFVGVTHALDGTIQSYIDGAPVGAPVVHGYYALNGWSRVGSSGYGSVETTGYPGALGAVIVVPGAIDASVVARIHEWARGRFGVR